MGVVSLVAILSLLLLIQNGGDATSHSRLQGMKESGTDKTGFTVEEFINGEYSPVMFNGTWYSGKLAILRLCKPDYILLIVYRIRVN